MHKNMNRDGILSRVPSSEDVCRVGIPSTLLHLQSDHLYSEQWIQSPLPGIGVGSGSVGMLAWNWSPVLVAVWKKMNSLRSVVFPIRKASGRS